VVARFRAGHISQEALAERAEIHRTQMSLYENGSRVLQLRGGSLCAISKAELSVVSDGPAHRARFR
jgi:transcriptional regulator with XRE-family HTH domain